MFVNESAVIIPVFCCPVRGADTHSPGLKCWVLLFRRMGVKDLEIFWSVEVPGNFVLSVNGIVWQTQLANEALPHQRLCSLWVSSSRLTTNRNLRWYLGFPKQEAAKSSKRAIHFPLIMMLLLNLLGGYWSVFRRVAREVFHPHFSPDERPTVPGVELREGCFSVQNW